MEISEKQAGSDGQMRQALSAIGSIAAGSFLLVTTEFLPIELLSRLATDLKVSEGVAGLSVTAPGLIAALAAPALGSRLGRWTRAVMIALTAAIVVSNVVAATHFVAYTFLEPYLRNALNLSQSGVAWALAGYAIAGIVGSFLGEHLAVRDIRKAFVIVSLLLAASVFAATAMAGTHTGAIAMVLVWGVAFGAVPVCVQIWMFTSSPQLYEGGSALMVSAFQIALAAGAAIGGALVDHAGIATNAGRIVNVSSIRGSLAHLSDPRSPVYPIRALGYDTSKAALNAFTILIAEELPAHRSRSMPFILAGCELTWVASKQT